MNRIYCYKTDSDIARLFYGLEKIKGVPCKKKTDRRSVLLKRANQKALSSIKVIQIRAYQKTFTKA